MTWFANFAFFLCLVTANALSIEKVSEKNNVTKRQADFFPDWVPFKNKHGEELGEFVSVPKTKVKKRLAPPVNFILRAVAEPEGDDYYDKGQGESDSDDYYEKKEWSDLNRPVDNAKPEPVLNHTDISDIDGVVGIITSKPDIDVSKIQIPHTKNTPKQIESKETSKEDIKDEKNEETSPKETNKDPSEEKPSDKKSGRKYEEEADYEESDVEKRKPEVTEEEQSESDAKKARILDSVDELKERHAEEQRAINEKVKEEELYKEEQERNNLAHKPAVGKYESRGKLKKPADYEEYEDGEVSIHDKYKINPFKEAVTTTRQPRKTRKPKIKNKKEEVGKLSVFKNPQLYMVYDDETSDETSTRTTQKTSSRPTTTAGSSKQTRFSSRYTTSTVGPEAEESVRISLVPHGDKGKEGEPRLFFPKTRKNKRRRKNKKTTPEPDSHVAETKKATGLTTGFTTTPEFTGTGPDITGTGTGVTGSGVTGTNGVTATASGSGSGTTAGATSGTGLDATVAGSHTTALKTAQSAKGAAVTDALPASSDHKKHENKDTNYEKGGGRDYKSQHHEQHEEHGKKAYEKYYEKLSTPSFKPQDMLKSKLALAKPWASIKMKKPLKVTTTKRTISANMRTTVATISTTTTNPATTVTTITKNMGKSKLSTKNRVNIRKATARKEATTSTKKTSTKRKSSSLKKKETQQKKKNTAATKTKNPTKRVDTLAKAITKLVTISTTKGTRATSRKAATATATRVTVPRAGTMGTTRKDMRNSTRKTRSLGRSGSTTTATPPRLLIWW